MSKSNYNTTTHTIEQNNHYSDQGNLSNLAYHLNHGGKQ